MIKYKEYMINEVVLRRVCENRMLLREIKSKSEVHGIECKAQNMMCCILYNP